MIDIPVLYKRKEQCCGCTACYAICPKGVISMVEDEEGLVDKMTKGKMNKVLVKLGME